MAKKSALDAKVAEIDGEIARLHTELIEWRKMRAYLTGTDVVTGQSTAPITAAKRTRGKGKARTWPAQDGSRQAVATEGGP